MEVNLHVISSFIPFDQRIISSISQINTKMSSIPQAIALTQLAMLAGSGLSAAPPKPDPAFVSYWGRIDTREKQNTKKK